MCTFDFNLGMTAGRLAHRAIDVAALVVSYTQSTPGYPPLRLSTIHIASLYHRHIDITIDAALYDRVYIDVSLLRCT
jgi:hypothetical protein